MKGNKLIQSILSLLGCGFILTFFLFSSCQRITKADSITKVEMHLSAFGVESDDFPSIDVVIDFEHDSSNCSRWFYNPSHQPSSYKLSDDEMKKTLHLLQQLDLKKLKLDYQTNMSDEPSSISTIYTSSQEYKIKDYGLRGEYPLPDLYQLVYKL